MTTIVYTDGACSGNPGPGGWAWVVPDGPYSAGHARHTTNQRMEITAASEAVRENPGPLEVRSDSSYVVNCFRDRWWEGWLARGWVNSQRKPVANRDLWEPLVDAVRGRRDVHFTWVKGHSGDHWNDVADRLAVAARDQQTNLRGARPPDRIGPPDAAAGPASTRPAGAGSPLGSIGGDIPGHPLVVLGHRSADLGGAADDVLRRLAAHVARRSAEVDDLVVVTGLRQGSEQLAAEAALAAGVPYLVVLPFPEPDRDWPAEERARFADLLAGASDIRTLEDTVPANRQAATAALARRDIWLARHAREAVLVWDGRDARLARLHGALTDALGDEVLALDPGGGDRARRPPRARRAGAGADPAPRPGRPGRAEEAGR